MPMSLCISIALVNSKSKRPWQLCSSVDERWVRPSRRESSKRDRNRRMASQPVQTGDRAICARSSRGWSAADGGHAYMDKAEPVGFPEARTKKLQARLDLSWYWPL